jgi:hypothetical protein
MHLAVGINFSLDACAQVIQETVTEISKPYSKHAISYDNLPVHRDESLMMDIASCLNDSESLALWIAESDAETPLLYIIGDRDYLHPAIEVYMLSRRLKTEAPVGFALMQRPQQCVSNTGADAVHDSDLVSHNDLSSSPSRSRYRQTYTASIHSLVDTCFLVNKGFINSSKNEVKVYPRTASRKLFIGLSWIKP